MAEKVPDSKPRVRWKRILGALLFLALVVGGVYGASWLNARRYFLIVDATEVHVARGRMLPVGHQPFVPTEVELRKAYETFPLPGGMNLPRGETVFTDRVELDQALFRVLKDAITFALSQDNRRTPELVARYLKQIKAIPGTSVSQQLELAALERDAAYVEARQHLAVGVASLKEAARLFRESAHGLGARARDGDTRADVIESLIARLGGMAALEASEKTSEKTRGALAPSRTSTAATSTAGARR